ncbi:MAG: DNA polymerase III subunit gamma/tau [Methylophilaceae bacterium]
MKNQALARKWRPKNFDSIVGQEFAIQAIKNSIQNERIHHAYLFSGTRGVGKTTIARIFAKCLNCQTGVTDTPCCECSSCLEIDQSKAIDVIELDAASNTQVDNMRELMENANYQPTSSPYKVFIIDEVHMLSKSSFNAMLKTLEEPPAHVIFILATTDPEKIPVTVVSRCLHFNLMQMTNEELIGQLKKIFDEEKINYDEPAVDMIAQFAEGSMRDALSLADRVINYTNGEVISEKLQAILGIISKDTTTDLIEAIVNNKKEVVQSILSTIKTANLSYENILKTLSERFYDISVEQTFNENPDRKKSMADVIDPKLLQTLYQITIHGLKDLPLAPNPYVGFVMTVIRLMNFIPNNNLNNISLEPNKETQPSSIKKSNSTEEPEKKNLTSDDIYIKINPNNWRQVVEQLKHGMAKTLAQNCEINSFSDQQLYLAVDDKFKHLNNDKYINILESSLLELTGERVRVFIQEAETTQTPAHEKSLEDSEALKHATNSIKSDQNLEKILNEFEGQIIEETIKPINH